MKHTSIRFFLGRTISIILVASHDPFLIYEWYEVPDSEKDSGNNLMHVLCIFFIKLHMRKDLQVTSELLINALTLK